MYALCDAKYFHTSNLEVYCGKQSEGQYYNSNTPIDIVKRLKTDIEKLTFKRAKQNKREPIWILPIYSTKIIFVHTYFNCRFTLILTDIPIDHFFFYFNQLF